ncbi:MarR family winged helix-turn-helix transcriptional regulator [Aegicerativicinus sediminis]|uniref:MarR family winged helix-turn-helix transcriptional regulator n=1 Tax=Aegicerativicinus sediminis TaxID=2893202 RepID=UPI001E2C53D2|nr:MarR family transcriptional regulator [Aegicerativicinus sediminis]
MGNIGEDIKSNFKNNRVKAIINILYTAGWISNIQNEFFKEFDISPQQFNILRILNGASGPLKVQTVKERMIDRAPNATRLMDKLCAKELIQRINCSEDRRVVNVEITDKGKNLLNKIPDDFSENLLKNITEEEAEALSRILDKIR